MRKFFGLIINEYVKIFCKVSTKIMLAAVILVAFGFNLLVYFASSEVFSSRSYYSWGAEEYISRAQNEKYEGWERDVELYTYFKENDISVSYMWNESNPDKWRTEAVYSLFAMKDRLKDAEADKVGDIKRLTDNMDAAIKSKDWKAYYRAGLESITLLGADYLYPDVSEEYIGYDIWKFQYKIDNDVAPESWKNAIVDDIAIKKQSLLDYKDIDKTDEKYEEKDKLQNELAIAEYRLEHNLESYTYEGIESLNNLGSSFGMWDIFGGSVMTISIISVLIIVIAGSLLSSEFSAGTVKFLLINPVKRWKIFAAKYVSALSITIISLFILYIFNLIFAGIFFGFKSIGAPFLSAVDGAVKVGSSFGYVAVKYLLGSVGMVCMATFAFAISSLVRNSALSIGLGVFLFLVGNSAVQILNQGFGLYQSKYILFANTDLNAVINGTTGFMNHTMTFALINIAVYMIVFIWTAWDGFVRNDIK